MTDSLTSLPIHSALPDLLQALRSHANVLLHAPPGAGKSTGVPLALLDAELARGKIIMLEPRRLAARSVALRMASTLNEPVGRTVGYRTRLDTKVSKDTRIEVVTEGILTRMLQHDAALEAVGAVIFDEFHERNLQADLALALCLDVQDTLRDDLKLLIMSATLDVSALTPLLGNAPLVSSPGQSFAVTTHYRSSTSRKLMEGDMARDVAGVIQRVLEAEAGDVLVFLPGQGEIRRTQQLLQEQALTQVQVLPLYGELSLEEQERALQPATTGTRKVVLATNLAETSLTIPGIRVVIDSGMERRLHFDPVTGMNGLELKRISRAASDQRRGRAGRTQAGVCYRLWTESEHSTLAMHTAPEILDSDLLPLALELACWGTQDMTQLRWLDAPPAAHFNQARDVLHWLGALQAQRITAHGRAMAELGTHPRLAHMLLTARDTINPSIKSTVRPEPFDIAQDRPVEGQRALKTSGSTGSPRTGSGAISGRINKLAALACELAALLGERDILKHRGNQRDVDLRSRLEALHGSARHDVDHAAKQRVERNVAQLQRQLRCNSERSTQDHDALANDSLGVLLALAFPDRIAQRRSAQASSYLLSNGRGASLASAHTLGNSDYLVVAQLDDADREARIHLAAPISLAQLQQQFADSITTRDVIEWSTREQCVLAQRETRLHALTLNTRRLDQPDADAVMQALLTGLREMGLAVLNWTAAAQALRTRLLFAAQHDANPGTPWPQVDDSSLLASLNHWLAPWLQGITRRSQLTQVNVHEALMALLDWPQQQRLNDIAPTHVTVPSGSVIALDYSGDTPTLSVRLQEVFGLLQTPRIGGGNVPVVMELLSPARRPVQVTRDLASFWASGYHEVKKDLKGRYPKHYWPDDPLQAQATARAKPRGT